MYCNILLWDASSYESAITLVPFKPVNGHSLRCSVPWFCHAGWLCCMVFGIVMQVYLLQWGYSNLHYQRLNISSSGLDNKPFFLQDILFSNFHFSIWCATIQLWVIRILFLHCRMVGHLILHTSFIYTPKIHTSKLNLLDCVRHLYSTTQYVNIKIIST